MTEPGTGTPDRRAFSAVIVALSWIAGATLACGGVPAPPEPPARPAPPRLTPYVLNEPPPLPPVLEPPRPRPPVVRWQPASPGEGTLVALLVEPRADALPLVDLSARSDGHRVPLVALSGGRYMGLLAAPLDARAVPLEIHATALDGTRFTLNPTVPVASRRFDSTQLSVARRFTSPDPETLKRIVRERERVRATLRRVTDAPLWNGAFVHPRPGPPTSTFGQRRLFNNQLRSRHTGLDIHADRGAPVSATNSGRVALAGDMYFSGNSVYLDHGLGLYTAYFHLSELAVVEGDWVEKGERIGRVGATGRVTGPHLHWGLYLRGTPLDPLSVFQPGLEHTRDRFTMPESLPTVGGGPD